MTAHGPLRPAWTCIGCGQPWPCHTRRAELLAEFDSAPVTLALVLAGYLVEACEDLPYEPAGPLYDRFVGWMRPMRRLPGRHS